MQRGQSLVKNSTTIMEKADYHSVVCFFFRLFLLAQTNWPCAQRPSAVNWRSRCRCRWQKKAARAHGRHPCFTRALVPTENTLVPTRSVVSAARQRNSAHRKSRLDIRLIPTARAQFCNRSVVGSTKDVWTERH